MHEAQLSEPKPPLTTSLLLREQHWGVAEGKSWIHDWRPGLSAEEHWALDLWPVGQTRAYKFPEGESLDDLAVRAGEAVDEILMPYVWSAVKEKRRGVHLAVVSHGLCISELVSALVKRDASGSSARGRDFRGLLNTAWTRVTVDVQVSWKRDVVVCVTGINRCPQDTDATFSETNPPPLTVRVTHFNQHDHLKQVVSSIINILQISLDSKDPQERQKGGVGSSAFDPSQSDIRAFFGGGAVSEEAKEEGRSESNAKDEVDVDI